MENANPAFTQNNSENLPTSENMQDVIPSDQPAQDCWKISCQTFCFACESKNAIDELMNKCECGEEQYVAQSFHFVAQSEHFIFCPLCKSNMVRLPCCDKFQ